MGNGGGGRIRKTAGLSRIMSVTDADMCITKAAGNTATGFITEQRG